METATWTLGLLAAVIAIVTAAVLVRGQRRRDEAARRAQAAHEAAALAQAAAAAEAERSAAAQRAADQARAEQARRAAAQHAQAEAQRAAAERASAAQAEQSRRAEAAEAAAAAAPQPPRRPEDTLVLVADDSKVVRVKTSRLLAQHGYRVVLAEDGTQAAQLLDVELPSVLITDVEMPGLDGFELTRHVRAHPAARHIPIIMITSSDERLKAAAADAGVTLVLGKPFPEEALIACIERSQATATA
jgi:CheY-like chemotaxis protein